MEREKSEEEDGERLRREEENSEELEVTVTVTEDRCDEPGVMGSTLGAWVGGGCICTGRTGIGGGAVEEGYRSAAWVGDGGLFRCFNNARRRSSISCSLLYGTRSLWRLAE